jgi:xanthosine utilization system XapX-like protein
MKSLNMKSLELKTPKVEGILFGLIVAIMLIMSPVPPGFALVVGIISGVVAFFVMSDSKKEQ